ncbi:uncharacterized protein A4U43_C05F6800 [Asparagus officinalis]|uniref:Endoplasmic reticulum vesicle transporter C-terminal domain-containing protein n=1 Tax=Asparagus officinalis TaxID=4686 RepID=A0A5P1EPV6_ASPOF|nr:uncharacterized protein A4U43_C05F6800 [Asparagus officinalis]
MVHLSLSVHPCDSAVLHLFPPEISSTYDAWAPEDNRIDKELLARLNNAKNENSFGRKHKDERKYDYVMSIPTAKEYVEPWVNECRTLPLSFHIPFQNGADLSHVFCTKDASPVIKGYSPELIKGNSNLISDGVTFNKVSNFHFAAGKSLHHNQDLISDLLDVQLGNHNITHKINKLSFGEEFPGVANPLDGAKWTHHTSSGIYQYFIKVIPTVYTDLTGNKI